MVQATPITRLTAILFLLFAVNLSLKAQSPQITSVSPLTGPVGSLVTLTGSNLISGSVVTIGGNTALTVSSNTTNDTLKVLVMPGISTGAITLTNTGGSQTFSSNFTVTKTRYPNTQQGGKLVDINNSGSQLGFSVAISADGNTAIVGGNNANFGVGGAWVYVRSAGVWKQQASTIIPTDYKSEPGFGSSVAISADGNTAIIGGPADSFGVGASWIYTRSATGNWSEQMKLLDNGSVGQSAKGTSVAISADGNTAVVGGNGDSSSNGAAWVYKRINGVWSQVGTKLVGTGNDGTALQGGSVAISADGGTILVGGSENSSGNGAVWVFKYDNTNGWIQQTKLNDNSDDTNFSGFGNALALSADGNTAIIGGSSYNEGSGGTWIFGFKNGSWKQQGNVLVGTGGNGSEQQGNSVAISADGNTALVGGSNNKDGVGSAWYFTNNNGNWAQWRYAFTGNGLGAGNANFGNSVALSSDGTTSIIGGDYDNNGDGAAWVYNYAQTPVITRFTPDTAIAGVVDTIYASNFSGVTQVSFGGIAATSFKITTVNGDSVILATVGNGASGYVSVANSNGVDSMAGFNFFKCYPVYSTTKMSLCADKIPYTWNKISINNPGTYTAHLNTLGGCDSIATLILSQDTLPDVQIIGETIGCDSVKLKTSGGIAYKWTGGATPNADTNIFKNDGNFTLTVTSGNGCSDSQDFTVVINPLPIPKILNSTTGCDSVTLFGDGGVEYAWMNGTDTLSHVDTVNLKKTGVITLTVTDENGCSASLISKDTVNTSPTIDINPIHGTTGCDTLVLVAVSNSKKSAFQWSGGFNDASDTNTFYASGNYNVVATDSITGCDSKTKSIDIVINYSPDISISGLDTACSKVNLTANSSSGATYSWSGGTTPTSASNTFTKTGNYTITVTGTNGCSNTDFKYLVVNYPPDLSIKQRNNCGDVALTAVATPSAFIKYDWGGYGHFPKFPTNNFDTSGTFTYSVTITDTNGCSTSGSQTITVAHKLFALNTVSSCLGTALFNVSGTGLDTANSVYIFKRSTYDALFGTVNTYNRDTMLIVHQDSTLNNSVTLTPYSPATSGNYFAAVKFRDGCSLVSQTDTIKQPSTDTITAKADAFYVWHGTNYTTSGNYKFDTINAVGCDSLTILKLTITSPATNTWTGIVSNDWFNPGNWTIGVPTSSTDALIPVTSVAPVIANGTANANNISIAPGTTLTNNATLNLYGNLIDSGSIINSNTSNVVLQGTGTLSGNTTFSNLEVIGNYAVGASITDKIAVTSILKKTSGIFTSNNKLTLISTAAASALIQENGGVLVGKAYIQHFTSGEFGYHHFSSPVNGATVNSWANSFPIFGPTGAPSWLSNRGSLQYYNEAANTTSLLDSSYYNYTNLSDSLISGQGYTAWLNSLPTLNTFGTPNNGPISIPVTHSTGTNAPKGWNMVGNPYPSPISWKALRALNAGLFSSNDACYLWKAAGKGVDGTWSTYNGTVGVNGAGDVINSSLGFFVYVAKSDSLRFDNSVRTYNYTSPEIFGTKSDAINTLRISIKDANSGTTDEAVAYTSYNTGYSRKMAQPQGANNATIAFDIQGEKAAINVVTSMDSKSELPLSISTPKAGTYTLSLNSKGISLPVYLKDAVTGTYTELSGSTTITTTATETSGRYSLVFSQPTVDRLPLTVAPNPARDFVTVKGSHIASLQVVDNLGRIVKVVALKDATNPTLNVRGLSAGAYHLSVQTTDGKVNGANLVVSY